MDVKELDYSLNAELIAREPRELKGRKRSDSKLLVMDRETGGVYHKNFADIVDYFCAGDVLVLNNSKTINARLSCTYNKAHQVNMDLFGFNSEGMWNCYIFPDVNCREGGYIECSNKLHGKLVKKALHNLWQVEFKENNVLQIANKIGKPIISHYIKDGINISYMQNVYANIEGSAELPAAGRHFDKTLLDRIKSKGVHIVYITLHTGMSSISVTSESFEEHIMHEEYIEISQETCDVINNAKKDRKRIFATGTTVMRTLESCSNNGILIPYSGFTSLYIYPGYEFKIVDSFITNFHGPRTSRIALAAAFSGKKLLLKGYEEAIKNKYLFFEFGDATLTV